MSAFSTDPKNTREEGGKPSGRKREVRYSLYPNADTHQKSESQLKGPLEEVCISACTCSDLLSVSGRGRRGTVCASHWWILSTIPHMAMAQTLTTPCFNWREHIA